MNLLVVESPTKARTLSKFLGDEFSVEATMGHVKDLPKSKLSVDVENNFEPDYQEVAKQEKTINLLKKAASKASMIYLATDPDREGEAISAHVKELVDGKSTKRIVFHEITKEAVLEAIAHPREVDTNLVDAQIARRVLDRLVGYKLSPILWKKVRRGLSAGRVQTVAVRLIVEKEREIEAFKAIEFWEIFSDVSPENSNEKFSVQLVKIDGVAVSVANKENSDQIVENLKKSAHTVSEVIKKEIRKNPYAPLTTSTMTQSGARIFGWAARRTMSIAQKLYEEGFITYHRTDSTNLAESALVKVRDFIKKDFGENYLPENARIFKTKSKSAQEAHEAIRPTDVEVKSESLNDKITPDMKKLYDLVWKRFVSCQMTASVYDQTSIEVSADKYLLRASGQIMKFDGWRRVLPASSDGEIAVLLPPVEKGETLNLLEVRANQKFTQPPARFNEASIIKTLEKLGIGRPSTYAPIISTIQARSYVEKKDGKFFATHVGVAVNDFLLANFPDVFEYAFTAEMEGNLDKVAEGKLNWREDLKRFYTPFEKKLDDVEKNAKRVKIEVEKLGITCPDCGSEHGGEKVIRIGRFGKFISCSRFPECKFTEKYVEKIDMECPKCGEGEVIVKKTGKGRTFFGCSRYPECDWAAWKNPKKEVAETN